ncbi:uncharacterized protein B0I36DRAFT_318452 [Microdochium trichocladiopsis]|uniref:F-box domain-containing protein n=1 Tax=Microdochium trichocladiopsis TaxID=1682393 RepID=A0A9P8YBS3_9PEZI|nr:uncharacterized protein B0I36DRAFT_318452 [Microdochium trichocladiopsis]KAH7035481.1 hypothetical protein B0I36DRAFT_318452 [Microdochium trichocladiopsis]
MPVTRSASRRSQTPASSATPSRICKIPAKSKAKTKPASKTAARGMHKKLSKKRGSTAGRSPGPATAAAAAAAAAVFAVPELLVEILANVDDTKTLLLAQRVSRAWHTAITQTVELQKLLFFHPVIARETDDVTNPETRRINPLLEERFPTFFPPHELQSGQDFYHLHAMQADWTDGNPFGFMEAAGSSRADREPYLRRGASWRRMLVQQPAVMKLGYIQNQGRSEQSYYRAVVDCRDEQGLRMGKLYDLVYQYAGSWKAGGLGNFTVYRRVPRLDPPVHSYSAKCGGEEVALSRFGPDVGFVALRNAAGDRYFPLDAITSKGALLPEYLPTEWQPISLKLEHTNSQDWFG